MLHIVNIDSRRQHLVAVDVLSHGQVCRQLALWWGVASVHHPLARDLEANVAGMQRVLLSSGVVADGDLLVITGSQPLKRGVHTNFVRFEMASVG